MKKKFSLICLCLAIVSIYGFSSKKTDDPVLLSIDNKNVSKSEFIRIYKKNNTQGTNVSSVKEYMELFINYKLKVIEAEHEGLDTVSSFIKEFDSYTDQLAKPYLTDSKVEDKLMHEAYERMKYEVHIRQIFIKCQEFVSPADTLAAYNKVLNLRSRLIKGEPWDSVVKASQDPAAKTNKGDFSYFTAFQVVYPFEIASYSLKVNEYSQPVRTKSGYYLIQLLDKRPSRGEIKVAHIMIAFPENATPSQIDSAKIKINDIYKRIKAGEKFEDLAKQYSDDKRSAVKGGELNWFTVGQMIPEFEEASFALKKDGDISGPIRTSFGWHIIKRLENRPISSFDDLKATIKNKINTDERANMGQLALIEQVKKEIKFKDSPEKIKPLYTLLDTSYFKGTWSPAKFPELNNTSIFTLDKKTYTLKDFAEYIASVKKYRRPVNTEILVNKLYKEYLNQEILNFENHRLDEKYPEFKYLVQEYHDGILLFNLMEKKVWNEAASDSAGLQKYYDDNKTKYIWGERCIATSYTSPKKEMVENVYNLVRNDAQNKLTRKEIFKKVCTGDDTTCISITDALFEKGDNTILDSIGWEQGISPVVFRDGKYGFFKKTGLKPTEQKTLQDAKGLCIADYQSVLEEKMISELRKKYKVTVNNKVLDSIKE